MLTGCEVIPEADRLIPVETESTGTRAHVLIEYTGFRCVNCPPASETAQSLHALYNDHLIVVALHPASNPYTQGKYDYTCPAADSIYQFMGGTSSTPFPTGNIDLSQTDGRWFFDPAEWPEQVSRAMEDTIAPSLTISTQTDTLSREVSVQADYIPAPEYRITYWIVEDSIQGAQAMPDGSVNLEYYHRHVLRFTSDEPVIPIPTECDITRCAIIALLIDNNDNHILNAYEKKLVNTGN